ncbi:putative riboflavin kinase [Bactrocera neohumeralis]|uniref:putative riboflavin kinase n=1 Tax=Bactrocera tryoni TaxID=59916 RepID=UPI001A9585A4|nr:putative riboflavin kinase [Bactrocera tryoni]XP_050333068.1 putative riboflavin kinase [Bactrocera neohumeralis]
MKSFRFEVLMRLHHLTACPTRSLIDICTSVRGLLSTSRKLCFLSSRSGLTTNTHNYSKKSDLKTTSYQKNLINKMLNHLPFFTSGEIVHGFGRGSKELGIPTANFPLEVVKALPAEITLGIYYGWASVDNGDVHKMVMSIGTNPYYDNKEKSMETHILHKFDGDLYGHFLKVCIVGYLRPERNFESLEELITAIQKDIADAKNLLEGDENNRQLQYSKYFKTNGDENVKSASANLQADNKNNGS